LTGHHITYNNKAMEKVTERRTVWQAWYETDTTKTGWDSDGWYFKDMSRMGADWTIVHHQYLDKFGNPIKGIAEREIEV
jgi:hypothetical protein